ncbi:MAG: sulfite exporter TauE/SafE family protein [Cocleimonas sp.]
MLFTFDIIIISAGIFFLAALVHGSIGFGFPMIATPLLALTMDIQSAIIITLIPTLMINLVTVTSEANYKLQGFIDAFKRNYLLAIYALLGTVVGTVILIYSNSELFKVLLAFAILVYLVSDHVKLNIPWIMNYPRSAKLIFGLSAGLLGGLTNVMAPVLIIYSLELKKSKRDIIQASNICFLFGKITQICLFTFSAKFTLNELSISSMMFVVSAIAITVGIQINKKINSEVYIKLLKLLLFSLAMVILLQFSFK